MAAAYPTLERLRELLDYDPNTGVFTWLVPRGRTGATKAGTRAGCLTQRGYVDIRVDNRQLRAHRLAWLHYYGQMPVGEIDHIDRNKSNNRICNLRDVDTITNQQNRIDPCVDNRYGLMGVTVVTRVGRDTRFKAVIRVGGHSVYIGQFLTPEAAHAAYMAAKRRLHAGFVN